MITHESTEDRNTLQSRIDQIDWYHDFDFPGGLRARTETPDKEFHRRLWSFIERNLDGVDFHGKTVLDIGSWDGYWSFYAERRGANCVIATDDVSQNWATGTGIQLAKSMLRSNIEINQSLSVYDIASLQRTFDVILCLGVYYHLYDPFYAFSQIRHCCHAGTVVVFEGDVGPALGQNVAHYCFDNPSKQAFIPSLPFLKTALRAAYFDILKTDLLEPYSKFRTARAKIKGFLQGLMPRNKARSQALNRIVVICKPFEGHNEKHHYAPPFGLRKFDRRFCGPGATRESNPS